MSPVIELNNLQKSFVLSQSGAASIKTLLLWWNRRKLLTLDVLKGVTFSVEKGECVGVIGRNGAGKSTLLSLLAQIYRPTSGEVHVRGRVAPLLELGAGFHPDLTGVENIYFNGVILGLTRAEIQARLPQIIEYSELGDHIHAPVRTYSSGMQARLGFSVAIHVDADILIVDEVLAVGDYKFEQKCFERISEFRRNGGTILLVSHQMDAVRSLADRVVWLQAGKVEMQGTPTDVIPAYLSTSS